MIKITAAEVQKLRQQTGAGMMDCKKALQESNGDFEKAFDYLRKKGQKIAANRADRVANEGFVLAKVNADKTLAVNVMVNCETDFVAKNQEFIDYVNEIAEEALKHSPKSLEELGKLSLNDRTVEEKLMDMVGKIGEKIELSNYEFIEAPAVYAYNHPGNRLATIIGLSKNDSENIDQLGHELAMQIAAMAPVAVDKDDIDPAIIEKEIEIGKEQARQEGKPEEMLEKISMGKLNKYIKENTLLNQSFVRDTKKTVREYIKENDKNLTVVGFTRLMLGA